MKKSLYAGAIITALMTLSPAVVADEPVYVPTKSRSAAETADGQHTPRGGSTFWTIPSTSKRWAPPPRYGHWTIPSISKRWHNPRKPELWTIPRSATELASPDNR